MFPCGTRGRNPGEDSRPHVSGEPPQAVDVRRPRTRGPPGDESDASHIGVTVCSAETEVGGEVRPKLVSVEQFDAPAVSAQL